MHRAKMPKCVGNSLNPCDHRYRMTLLDKIQIGIMTFTVLPVRLLMILVCLIALWLTAFIATLGLDVKTQPIQGWRKKLSVVFRFAVRCAYFSVGYFRIRVVHADPEWKSKQEAPIMVGAPHTSFMDVIMLFACRNTATGVSRNDNEHIPVFGTILRFVQPVYVFREDGNSRQNTIKELCRRASSNGVWPPIVIFPEATCTNASCLLNFKLGAFIPGQPVQPVVVKHINKMDTLQWPFDVVGVYKIAWLTLCQFYTDAELYCLPIYTPSEEEKKDAKLFASNVRRELAKALKVPTIDVNLEELPLVSYANKLQFSGISDLVQFQRRCRMAGLNLKQVQDLVDKLSISLLETDKITITDFTQILDLQLVTDDVQKLFDFFDIAGDGKISTREFVEKLNLISQPSNIEEIIRHAFQIFDHGKKGYVTEKELQQILCMLGRPTAVSDLIPEILSHSGNNNSGKITYDEFKEHAKKKEEFEYFFLSYKELLTSPIKKMIDTNDNIDIEKSK